jgi:Alr-MurF fusion protein
MIQYSAPKTLRSTLISLDSRQIYDHAQTAFFAVKGLHHDGHQFLEILYKKGVQEFIVEEAAWQGNLPEKAKNWTNVQIWVVKNSIACLQTLAIAHRNTFHYPVVGITGSNGKTICKEWLATLVQSTYQVCKSPKSFNSQIGVPLSVMGMKTKHQIGIFEAGISQVGEMEKLEKIIQPNLGLFTHFGEAHGSNFRDDDQKLEEKLRLFKHCKQLIYRATDGPDRIKLGLKDQNPTCELISWSSTDPNKSIFVHYQKLADGTQIKIQKRAQSEPFLDIKTELTDDASLENITHCLIAGHTLGLSSEILRNRIRLIKPISMRLEIKEGIRGNQLIDDSYNNDLDGLKLALPLLKRNDSKKKILIISDFLETGIEEQELYQSISALIHSQKIDMIIGIGDQLLRNQVQFEKITVFSNTDELMQSGILNQINDSIILLKGARKFNFERLVQALETKSHCTSLEVNLDALQANLRAIKQVIGPDTKLMVMIKAFAYGAGAVEIGQIVQQQGVDYVTVAYTDEGVELRKNGIYMPIMVMNPQVEEFDKLTEYALEPEIYSFDMLRAIDEYSTSQSKNIKIHLKLDTGMKRLGFEAQDVPLLTELITQMPQLWVVSILSHLAASENPKHEKFTMKQISIFQKMAKQIQKKLGYSPILHIANSAAIQNYPTATFDMVRLGISLYGISSKSPQKLPLENVLTLKTYISQIKEVKKGESIGYERKGKLNQAGRIATLAIGYADGYTRTLGMGEGSFEIMGQLCPTVGAICMDMTMVDISHVPQVKVGDEAIAFGGKIQLSELAKNAKTIPYEIMTNISERVKRVYVRN